MTSVVTEACNLQH